MQEFSINYEKAEGAATVIYVAIDGNYIGYALIEDQAKETSKDTIKELKKLGVKRTVMLTGDRKEIADKIAKELALDDVYSELLPADKVEHVEKLLKDSNTLAFVGDGVNDAPVLARADVGIAMGAMGSDAAIEAADIVLMDDNPKGISKAIKLARHTINIVFALAVKIAVLILAAIGIATMWTAVFADVGVCVIAILNAMRCSTSKE
jgi:Cd2+/Zn2+-exporting ATPase